MSLLPVAIAQQFGASVYFSTYARKGDTAQAQLHAQQAQVLAGEMGLQMLVASVPNILSALATQHMEASAEVRDA